MLSFEDAVGLLDVDAEAGKLFWKERPASAFSGGKRPAAYSCKAWNKRFRGKEALNAAHNSGYRFGCINNYPHLAHRIIWLLHTGSFPSGEIDHVNGDRSDNRISNLRDVSHSDNLKNQRKPKNNTSGHIGVYWIKKSNRWQAQIKINQKKIHLGMFRDFDAAVNARKIAEIKFDFHRNHGACK